MFTFANTDGCIPGAADLSSRTDGWLYETIEGAGERCKTRRLSAAWIDCESGELILSVGEAARCPATGPHEPTVRRRAPRCAVSSACSCWASDSALLRYSIGNEYARSTTGRPAIGALAEAVALDPTVTAAWKLYAKTLDQRRTHSQTRSMRIVAGIVIARQKGDRQAEREMTVFARRIERALPAEVGSKG